MADQPAAARTPNDLTCEWAQSAEIGEIMAAVSTFQRENPPIAKQSKVNPHFKSQYADLKDVTEIAALAAEHDLGWVQLLGNNSIGDVTVTTILGHKSGQWFRSTVCLPPVKRDPQGYGSAVAYMRRYGLAAVLGIAYGVQDDDGENASAGMAMVNVQHVDWSKLIDDATNDRELRRIYRQAQRAYQDDPDGFSEIEKQILARRNQPEVVKNGAEDAGVAKGKGGKNHGDKG